MFHALAKTLIKATDFMYGRSSDAFVNGDLVAYGEMVVPKNEYPAAWLPAPADLRRWPLWDGKLFNGFNPGELARKWFDARVIGDSLKAGFWQAVRLTKWLALVVAAINIYFYGNLGVLDSLPAIPERSFALAGLPALAGWLFVAMIVFNTRKLMALVVTVALGYLNSQAITPYIDAYPIPAIIAAVGLSALVYAYNRFFYVPKRIRYVLGGLAALFLAAFPWLASLLSHIPGFAAYLPMLQAVNELGLWLVRFAATGAWFRLLSAFRLFRLAGYSEHWPLCLDRALLCFVMRFGRGTRGHPR